MIVSHDWRRFLAPAALALLTLALFRSVLGHEPLMFDDDINIYHNPHLGQLTWSRLAWMFADDEFMPRYMPLGWLQLVAAFELGGLGRGAFHLFNLVFHAVNAGLFALALRHLLARAAPGARGAGWVAALAAAAWAWHPLRAEPVGWATGVHYVHATFWALIATNLLLADGGGRARRIAAILAFACSGLVYPVALGLPAAMLAFDVWLRRGEAGLANKLAWTHAPFFAVAALALGANIWARFAAPGIYPASPALAEFGVLERLGQAFRALAYYLWRPALPGDVTGIYNELFRAPGLGWRDGIAASCLLGLAGLAFWLFRRGRPGAVAWGLGFAAVCAPYLGLLEFPFQTSDRYTYFPSLLWLAGIALLTVRLPERGRVGGQVALALGCVWLGWATMRALPAWRDTPRFFGHVAARLERPDVAASYRGRGAIYLARRGDFSGAEETLARMAADGAPSAPLAWAREEVASLRAAAFAPTVLALPPEGVPADARAALALARAAARAGEARTAEHRFRRALELAPSYHDARHDLVVLLAARGRRAEAAVELARIPSGVLDAARESTLRALLAGPAAPLASD